MVYLDIKTDYKSDFSMEMDDFQKKTGYWCIKFINLLYKCIS